LGKSSNAALVLLMQGSRHINRLIPRYTIFLQDAE
jgi:hypothetical protein